VIREAHYYHETPNLILDAIICIWSKKGKFIDLSPSIIHVLHAGSLLHIDGKLHLLAVAS
jgi:hypothetical protein